MLLLQRCPGGLCLFIRSKDFCRDLIKTLRENNELEGEYIYNKQIHVIEIRPDINYTSFLEGEYTKIYTKDQLKRCFRPDSKLLMILEKDPRYFNEYFQFIRKQFGNNITESSVRDHKQYDMMPNLNQEIMSYE